MIAAARQCSLIQRLAALRRAERLAHKRRNQADRKLICSSADLLGGDVLRLRADAGKKGEHDEKTDDDKAERNDCRRDHIPLCTTEEHWPQTSAQSETAGETQQR